MADWFMLKSAVYLWTLGLQVRLDCVTFPLFQNILCRCDWTDMCKKDFFFRQKPSRFLQLLPILDKINTGLESDPSSNKLHSACCFGAKGEKFWWVVLTHFLQLSPLRNAKYFTQVCFLYLFMYLSTQILRLIYVHQRNKFIGSMNIFKWLPTYPE